MKWNLFQLRPCCHLETQAGRLIFVSTSLINPRYMHKQLMNASRHRKYIFKQIYEKVKKRVHRLTHKMAHTYTWWAHYKEKSSCTVNTIHKFCLKIRRLIKAIKKRLLRVWDDFCMPQYNLLLPLGALYWFNEVWNAEQACHGCTDFILHLCIQVIL